MGNNQITPKNQNQKFTNDPHYGGNIIVNNYTKTVYQQFFLDEKHLFNFQNLLQKRKKLIHPNLVTVKNSFSKDVKNVSHALSCTSDKKTEIFVEYNYFQETLEDVIAEHSLQNCIIAESEIRRIFDQIVGCLNYLKMNKTCHGDIKTGNILFDKLNNVKLIDSYFVNGGKTSYEIVMQNPSSMSLLSPEQLQNIKNRQCQNLQDIYQNQMFSVGLVMIQAMTFQPAMECYDLLNMSIKDHYSQRKQQQLHHTQYSRNLIYLVIACISQNKSNRPSFDKFLEIIRHD